jgi:PiT family inorganic phosphate transporter
MRPRFALALVGLAEFCGPFVFGLAVASTVGHDLIRESAVTTTVILSVLGAAIIWNVCMILLGLPASSTHALVGSLIGAAFASSGVEAILVPGVLKLLAVLFISPLIGFAASYIILRVVLFMCQNASPSANTLFKRLQIITAASLGLSHGSNDAQKSIGLIALGLATTGTSTTFEVPLWAVFVGAGSLALGAFLGGERVIRTVGCRIFRIRPVHGFSAQLTSTLIVWSANMGGQPISTTQVISSSVVGVGASERFSRVRWTTAGNIALAWLVTLPAVAVLSGLLWRLLSHWLPF